MRHVTLAILLIFFLIPIAAAAPGLTQNTTPDQNATPVIENGQCVALNSTVDIGSLGWGIPHISWYGRYENSLAPDNSTVAKQTLDMPNTVSALSQYYIDPRIFGPYPGFWYQDYGRPDLNTAANLRMFYVNDTCPPPHQYQEIVVQVNVTNKTIPQRLDFLPDKHMADILVARGDDSMPIDEGEPFHWWLFGTYHGVYDQSSPATSLIIPSEATLNFEPGNYDLVEVYAGHNNLLEENYQPDYKYFWGENRTHEVIISPLRSVVPVDITQYDGQMQNPRAVEPLLINAVRGSLDDAYKPRSVLFQEPDIQIMRLDAITNPSNDTWYNIRGYTNAINGTALTITIDPKTINQKTIKARQFTTTAEGLDPGSYRQFDVLVPIDYTQIFPGYHDLEVSEPNGANQIIQFYVYKELPPHYIPPQYVEYLGASPYITPEKIPVPYTVTVTVPVPVTPSDEQVHAQQVIAEREVSNEHDRFWVMTGCGVAMLALLGYYAWTVIRRRKEMTR